MNWFMAFLHHLIVFTLVISLVYERLLIHKPLTWENAKSLLRVDQLYGACAMMILIIGGLRLFYFEKGSAYYFHSAPFIAKLALFALVGILSIYPTITFARWQKSIAQQKAPEISEKNIARIKTLVTFEIAGVIGILLCSAMAAKGIGYLS